KVNSLNANCGSLVRYGFVAISIHTPFLNRNVERHCSNSRLSPADGCNSVRLGSVTASTLYVDLAVGELTNNVGVRTLYIQDLIDRSTDGLIECDRRTSGARRNRHG